MTAGMQISEKPEASPSPFGRRWRGAPDEGQHTANPHRRSAPPSPGGRGIHSYMMAKLKSTAHDFVMRHCGRLPLPVSPEVDIAIMASEKVHEPLVISIRHPEQGKHLLVTAARPLETLPDDMLDLSFCDHPLRIRPRDRFPEIANDQFVHRPRSEGVLRQQDVIGLNDAAVGSARRRFDDILKFANITGKDVRHEFS